VPNIVTYKTETHIKTSPAPTKTGHVLPNTGKTAHSCGKYFN